MAKFNMESFETIMSLVNNPDEYKKKIDALNEKIQKADEAVAKMQAEQSRLIGRQEDLEEAIAANHKAKSTADQAIEFEKKIKQENIDILNTLKSKQTVFDAREQDIKKQEQELEKKLRDFKDARRNLDQGREDLKEKLARLQAKEDLIKEFIQRIS